MKIETRDEAIEYIMNDIYFSKEPKNNKEFFEELKQVKFVYDSEMSDEEKFNLDLLFLEKRGKGFKQILDEYLNYGKNIKNTINRELKEFTGEKATLKEKIVHDLFYKFKQHDEISYSNIKAYELLYQMYKDSEKEPKESEPKEISLIYEYKDLHDFFELFGHELALSLKNAMQD